MANIKYNLHDLSEEMAERLTDAVDQETLEQFFYEQHVEFYRDLGDVGRLEQEAKALGLIADEDTLELV